MTRPDPVAEGRPDLAVPDDARETIADLIADLLLASIDADAADPKHVVAERRVFDDPEPAA